MREIFLILFLLGILFMALRRPYFLVLGFCYVDIVAPQRLSYSILPHANISLVLFVLAILGWLIADNKKGMRIDHLQGVLAVLMLYCGITTIYADFPADALDKWAWVWKALIWSMFLPLVLRTKLRIEALALIMVLSAGALAISGGLKTVTGGSGYGTLQILLDDNSGLFEGSIFSTVAIAIIPLILWLARYGTVFKPSPYVWAFALALCFACLMIPVGTQARTGLLCAALLALLGLRDSKRRMMYLSAIGAGLLVALPLLPAAFSARMDTIANYQSDSSASTRLAVWEWTWNHALDHPLGSGFEMYRANELQAEKVIVRNSGGQSSIETIPYVERGRAFHNSYFEMLGEQGFPGLALWLYIQIVCLWRMERIRRRYAGRTDDDAWVRPLATALQGSQLVYMLGSMFVGIAFQPFIYMLIAMQIGLHTYITRREAEARWRPLVVEAGRGRPGGAVATSANGWRGGS
jgi:probable O-glycosylation ligase (exosortase A-associated)